MEKSAYNRYSQCKSLKYIEVKTTCSTIPSSLFDCIFSIHFNSVYKVYDKIHPETQSGLIYKTYLVPCLFLSLAEDHSLLLGRLRATTQQNSMDYSMDTVARQCL